MSLRSALTVSVAINALIFVSTPGWAQEAVAPPAGASTPASNAPAQPAAPAAESSPPKESSAAATSDIVVTGSRVARQGFDAPTPTIVLSSDLMNQRGATNVGDFLNELPSFRVSQSTQTNPQSSAQGGQVYADLRGLGSIRTLVLVDGRRHVPSAATGQVDINLVPTILVDRVEVVTGGASAAYGSDAVSGVVNIILDKKLQGFKGDVSTGISNEGDNWERRISLAFGTEFSEGRGHIVIGGDYVKSDGVDSYLARDWGRRDDELITFGANRPAGTPSRLYASGVSYTGSPEGGVIIGPNADTNPANGKDVLRGIGFLPGGGTYAFNYGNDTGSGSAYNNTSKDGSFTRLGHALILPEDRHVVMTHLDYDLSSNISFFVEGSYARSGASFNGPSPRDTNTTTIVIQRDNAYLPASVAAIMAANNINSFSLGRANVDFAQSFPKNFNTTERVVGGLNGKLGGGWSWDAYYQYGRNVFDSEIDNIRIEQNFKFAFDAVVNPANGQVTCRALVPGSSAYNPIAAAGCVPVNLFGVGSPSAAAAAYINGTQFYKVTTTQEVAAANLRGNLFSTWAGPVAVAVGGEYRVDTNVGVVDSLAEASAYNFSNPKAFSGSFNTKEGYVEALVPLAKDSFLAQSLDLNGAVRYTDYSSSGPVTTWKVGGTWEPVKGFKLRATRSRDIRAPNASELFSFTSANSTLLNTFSGQTRSIPVINEPSASLEPEKADTTTAGFVFSPRFLPGLNLSVDYFNIDIKGAIASYGAQSLIDSCFAETQRGAPGFFCSFLSTTGTGAATVINSVSVQLLNIASLKSSGVDFDASYRTRLGAGTLTGRFFGTYTAHLISDDGLGNGPSFNAAGVIQSKGSVIDRAGQVGGFFSGANNGATSVPHWQLNGSLTYADSLFSTTFQGRYVGGGKLDKTLVDPSEADYNPASPISVLNNDAKGRFYLNWSGSVNVIHDGNRKVEFYVVINNLTNVDPPFPATQISGIFDKLGRDYQAGIRFAY